MPNVVFLLQFLAAIFSLLAGGFWMALPLAAIASRSPCRAFGSPDKMERQGGALRLVGRHRTSPFVLIRPLRPVGHTDSLGRSNRLANFTKTVQNQASL
jgi:hypothetical protein